MGKKEVTVLGAKTSQPIQRPQAPVKIIGAKSPSGVEIHSRLGKKQA
jgi:hypothetical protein